MIKRSKILCCSIGNRLLCIAHLSTACREIVKLLLILKDFQGDKKIKETTNVTYLIHSIKACYRMTLHLMVRERKLVTGKDTRAQKMRQRPGFAFLCVVPALICSSAICYIADLCFLVKSLFTSLCVFHRPAFSVVL